MGDPWLRAVGVRPVARCEQGQYRELMDRYHYLGFGNEVGARVYHVAEVNGQWVGLVSWAAAALKLGTRDRWLGCRLYRSPEKLRCIVNNTRFLVLPQTQRPHLASRVLGLSCKRLSHDWRQRYGYGVLLAETFVASGFKGTCYRAAGWHYIGDTRGWGRKRPGYTAHGKPKGVWVKELIPKARAMFRSPLALPFFTDGATMPQVDIDTVPIVELRALFQDLTDPRSPLGKQHKLVSLMMLITLGTLSGLPCIAHIAQWAKSVPKEFLKKLGFRAGLAPSHATLHRISHAVDVDEFVAVARKFWNNHNGSLAGKGVTVDGKTLRGAKEAEGKAPHVLAATTHDTGMLLAQVTVPEKTNEIGALPTLLDPIDLSGAMVTIDAMHTNEKTAHYLTKKKPITF